ncbi:MAG: hypothetical protein IK016_09510 [Lachnospiraceae bacterium]|nr:hypothetical protein [Lachnospiraceae bacterium]
MPDDFAEVSKIDSEGELDTNTSAKREELEGEAVVAKFATTFDTKLLEKMEDGRR